MNATIKQEKGALPRACVLESRDRLAKGTADLVCGTCQRLSSENLDKIFRVGSPENVQSPCMCHFYRRANDLRSIHQAPKISRSQVRTAMQSLEARQAAGIDFSVSCVIGSIPRGLTSKV